MSKIGRNDPCPCGSGKKYKKCCLNKEKSETKKIFLSDEQFGYELFAQHDYYLHNKKVKNEKINKKLLNIYDNRDTMTDKEIMKDYLEIMNALLDYAEKNNVLTLEELDKSKQISDFSSNVITDASDIAYNLTKNDYDLEKVINYIDRLVDTLDLDYNTYEWQIRTKSKILFELGKIKEGEKVLTDELEKDPKFTYYYVDLIDNFNDIDNKEKAKYYYDLALSYDDIEDRDVIEEREDYFS